MKSISAGADGRRAGPFRSDAAGRYTAYGLRTGLWTVLFIPESSGLLSEYYADSPNRAGAQPIDVKFGRTVEASATIARAARISGLVTDEARGAIPGVKVTVYDGFGANVQTKPDWSPVEKDMLKVIDLEKLLAIERATVENGKH